MRFLNVRMGTFGAQVQALLWAILILVSSAIPGEYFPSVRFWWLAKLVHVVYYFFLCMFTYRAFRFQTAFPILRKHAILLSFFLTSLYGVTDEVHQIFVAGRHPALTDVAIDTASGGLFVISILLISLLQSFRREPASS